MGVLHQDQKIAAFGSSYRRTPVGAAEGCDLGDLEIAEKGYIKIRINAIGR
jgi:hypothetical protein